MKKTLLLLSLLIATTLCYGQSKDSISDLNLLLNLKSTIEKHFSGTNIHGANESFVIEYNSSSKRHAFLSKANDILPVGKSKALDAKINKFLKNQHDRKLVGTIYFDKYLDSTLVDIEYFKDEEVYRFNAMTSVLQPPGGLSAFSKRLHDFLKEQIATKQLLLDSVLAQEVVNVNVDGSGSLSQVNNFRISKLIDVFLKSERRWNPGILSGPSIDMQVEFKLLDDYLTNKTENWPTLDDFSEYSNIKFLSSKKIGSELTFYSTSLPRKFNNKNYTVVSFMYDGILEKYRFPSVQSGNFTASEKLINDILRTSPKENFREDLSFMRIYFYRN